MEEILHSFFSTLHWSLLLAVIVVAFGVLARSADWLVDEAVALSERSGLPKTVIGATIVSLGTTTPEAAVSVLAAIQGNPGLALGNAVGSIIVDTGLILGLACVLAPLPLDRRIANRQGWVQLSAAFALVLACTPWSNPLLAATTGGRLPQWAGWLFVAGLIAYLWKSVQWASASVLTLEVEEHERHVSAPVALTVLRLLGAVALVVASAHVVIPAVAELARRLGVAESIIAATLVAFGTSLPELVTAIASTRRGHGELALGNVIGADILNVLFVSGLAAAVTPAGLVAGPYFFKVLFPIMIGILLVFRIGILTSRDHLRRPFGIVLLAAYAVTLLLSYLLPAAKGGM